MNLKWKLKNLIFTILHPSFWVSNIRTNWFYDEEIRNQMECGPIVYIDCYVVKVGTIYIWIRNYPYCYGYIWEKREDGLPAPLTRVELKEILDIAFCNQLSQRDRI